MPQVWTGQWSARLEPRPGSENKAAGLHPHPVADRVASARLKGEGAADRVAPTLRVLDSPAGLPDIRPAADRLVAAIVRGERIGVVTDHDVDGCTGHAVVIDALTRHFGVSPGRIRSYIGHRLKDGYGVTDPVVDRILTASNPCQVVITVDCGSSDEARIKRLAEAGVDVIVTDHHELPEEGPPASAFACVTPQRADSTYPDRTIAGVMVAWLLMSAVRGRLVAKGRLPQDAPRLASSLDYVALGTVADCVSLARSANNRAVVRAGLLRIANGSRPCWKIARAWVGEGAVSAQSLAFQIGPRLNARGRLDEAMAGVHFLLADGEAEARQWGELLDQENVRRREIEKDLVVEAQAIADAAVEEGRQGLALWLPNGHPGVHGIVASRVVERYGRPVVCISPHFNDEALATGSARGVPGFHVREALQAIANEAPDLMTKFGGHEGAAGLSLPKGRVDEFIAAFDRAACAQLARAKAALGPVVLSDGELGAERLEMTLLDALAELEPYGREFEPPLFEGDFTVVDQRPVGAGGEHLKLTLEAGGRRWKGIWFRAMDENDPVPLTETGETVRLLFSPEPNVWKGRRELQLRIVGLVVAPDPAPVRRRTRAPSP
jgi:single-stranded-DNA-specific exonuclease